MYGQLVLPLNLKEAAPIRLARPYKDKSSYQFVYMSFDVQVNVPTGSKCLIRVSIIIFCLKHVYYGIYGGIFGIMGLNMENMVIGVNNSKK